MDYDGTQAIQVIGSPFIYRPDALYPLKGAPVKPSKFLVDCVFASTKCASRMLDYEELLQLVNVSPPVIKQVKISNQYALWHSDPLPGKIAQCLMLALVSTLDQGAGVLIGDLSGHQTTESPSDPTCEPSGVSSSSEPKLDIFSSGSLFKHQKNKDLPIPYHLWID